MKTTGDQTDNAVGQPQSGLWFGNIDDLWKMGKPSSWGGPWRENDVAAGKPSDPFLMTGFDRKVLHLTHESETEVRFTVEVDFLDQGTWVTYRILRFHRAATPATSFPTALAPAWVRLSADRNCRATAYFMYH